MMNFIRKFKHLGFDGGKAQKYDSMSRENRMTEFQQEAREIASWLKPGSVVLDVGSGPGYLAIEIAKLGDFKVSGLDVSGAAIDIAKKNAEELGQAVRFFTGSASQIPFGANSIDGIVCVLAFKNFKGPLECLNEFYRVLRPGGQAVIFDLDRNMSLARVKNLAAMLGLKGFTAYFAAAIQRSGAYTRDEIRSMVGRSCFEGTEIGPSRYGMKVTLNKGERVSGPV